MPFCKSRIPCYVHLHIKRIRQERFQGRKERFSYASLSARGYGAVHAQATALHRMRQEVYKVSFLQGSRERSVQSFLTVYYPVKVTREQDFTRSRRRGVPLALLSVLQTVSKL